MNFLLFLEFVFLFNAIKGEENPYLTAPREQELSEPLMMGKTIIISGKNGQINTEDPNVMQAVMNAVNNFKSDGSGNGKDVNGNDIPEVIITDSEQELPQGMGSPLESIQKVYNLPPMTRMIASQEEPDNKKSPLWRSPLPFLHPNECPHKNQKKSKLIRKKSRKHHKRTEAPPPTPSPVKVKPVVEENEREEPFRSLLSSLISNSVFTSGAETENEVSDVRPPTSFLMSISHRVHPQPIELPLLSKPRPHGFIAILHKRHEPIPFPMPVPQPEPQFIAPIVPPMSPFNPFLALLSKMEEPMEPKVVSDHNSDSEPKDSTEKSGRHTNYNFNVNLTVNNYNYAQPGVRESVRPPFFN